MVRVPSKKTKVGVNVGGMGVKVEDTVAVFEATAVGMGGVSVEDGGVELPQAAQRSRISARRGHFVRMGGIVAQRPIFILGVQASACIPDRLKPALQIELKKPAVKAGSLGQVPLGRLELPFLAP
jgi:hypothetical protein